VAGAHRQDSGTRRVGQYRHELCLIPRLSLGFRLAMYRAAAAAPIGRP
jgi:hypothetical protein